MVLIQHLALLYAGGIVCMAFALAALARQPGCRPALRQVGVSALGGAVWLSLLWLPVCLALLVWPSMGSRTTKRRKKRR